MFCEYCSFELVRYLDAYSCPECHIVSNEIVFGCQKNGNDLTFSYGNIRNCEKISCIENACIQLHLPKSVINNSSKIFYKLISKKLKSSYSHNFYKAFSILKAGVKENIFINSQELCSIFLISNYKFFKFKKYLLSANIDYLQPPTLTQQCDKILNILNVQKYETRLKITKLAFDKIKKTDINIKIILLQVYCTYFDIDIKSTRFKDICEDLNVNEYAVYKYCKL